MPQPANTRFSAQNCYRTATRWGGTAVASDAGQVTQGMQLGDIRHPRFLPKSPGPGRRNSAEATATAASAGQDGRRPLRRPLYSYWSPSIFICFFISRRRDGDDQIAEFASMDDALADFGGLHGRRTNRAGFWVRSFEFLFHPLIIIRRTPENLIWIKKRTSTHPTHISPIDM